MAPRATVVNTRSCTGCNLPDWTAGLGHRGPRVPDELAHGGRRPGRTVGLRDGAHQTAADDHAVGHPPAGGCLLRSADPEPDRHWDGGVRADVPSQPLEPGRKLVS